MGIVAQIIEREGRRFNREWTDSGSKIVVPILETSMKDGELAARVSSAATRLGVNYGLVAKINQGHLTQTPIRVQMLASELAAALPNRNTNALLVLEDLSAALLITNEGYSLLAGNLKFVRASLNIGIDEAKARFLRHARRVAESHPEMIVLAHEYMPRWRAWRSPSEVQSESYTSRQLSLMELFIKGHIEAARFSREWLAARRMALDTGERLRDGFDNLMNEVFYTIDDYVIDPKLRDEGDMSEGEFKFRIARILDQLKLLA